MATYGASILGLFVAAVFATGGCSGAVATPSPTILRSPSLTSTPTASPTSTSEATPTQAPAPMPTSVPTPDTSGVATRIVVALLKIDLPVVDLPAPPDLPYCDVAMWWTDNGNFVLPGRRGGSTFVLAQPRAGMFRPLLDAS